jgi:S1-C subfamily serine protease
MLPNPLTTSSRNLNEALPRSWGTKFAESSLGDLFTEELVNRRYALVLATIGILIGIGLSVLFVTADFPLTSGVAAQPSDTTRAQVDASPLTLETFRQIAKAQSPMVVNIRTEWRRQTRSLSEFFGDDALRRFFGAPELPGRPREELTEGAGTGFIFDKTGLILTNNHVVAGANKIRVALYADEDGVEYDGRIVGRDPLTDTAIVELIEKPDNPLPTSTLGNSSAMQPGDWVIASATPSIWRTPSRWASSAP